MPVDADSVLELDAGKLAQSYTGEDWTGDGPTGERLSSPRLQNQSHPHTQTASETAAGTCLVQTAAASISISRVARWMSHTLAGASGDRVIWGYTLLLCTVSARSNTEGSMAGRVSDHPPGITLAEYNPWNKSSCFSQCCSAGWLSRVTAAVRLRASASGIRHAAGGFHREPMDLPPARHACEYLNPLLSRSWFSPSAFARLFAYQTQSIIQNVFQLAKHLLHPFEGSV